MTYRVALVGGGSGGHVYPLVAVARALQAQATAKGISLQLMLFGDGPYLERAAHEAGIPYHTLIAPKLRRYASAGNILDIFKIPLALVQSLWRMFWFMPDVVFAKGGYTCAFPTLAARVFFIPVYLHESDSIPGLANRILARRSKLVFTSFTSADQFFAQMRRPTMLVGNPIRTSVAGISRDAAHKALGLDVAKKTVFIAGGSQGAQQINDLVLNALVQLVQKGYNIIHQAGDHNFSDVKKAVEQYMTEGKDSYAPLIATQYRVYPFLDEGQLATAFGAADIVVNRASAGAISEISLLSKPCILIPLPGSANDHQLHNAAELAKYGAVIMDGANVTPQLLIAQLDHLADPAVAADISSRIKAFAKPDAASRIAAVLLDGQ
jgi:UDP-N-acetylglucosamine--N-acetylmuramyl-(pentapeptide) pyrophosphoryl-undecaprenol N-acetylglucosamine transferase